MVNGAYNRSWLLRVPLAGCILGGTAVFTVLAFWSVPVISSLYCSLFLLLVPGLLIYLRFFTAADDKEPVVRAVCFGVGLSLANILALGLLANYGIGLFLDKPLRLAPLVTLIDVEMVVLWWLYRHYQLPTFGQLSHVPHRFLQKLTLAVAAALPLIAILGAIQLNNGGSGILAMGAFIGVAIAVILGYLSVARRGGHIAPLVLYSVSLTVLLAGWLRSSAVSGVDVNLEYHIFQITQQLGEWSPGNFPGQAYNACLSITILPVVIGLFTAVPDVLIFKVYMPMLFALTPVVVYAVARQFFSRQLAFLAGVFFMCQAAFIVWLSIPVRQEIALLFFSLLIAALLGTRSPARHKLLVIICTLAVIVSHYSTAYVMCVVLLLTYVLYKLFLGARRHTAMGGVLRGSIGKVMTVGYITIVLLSTFLWYAQTTQTSSGIQHFITQSVTNIDDLLSDDVQNDRSSLSSQFDLFYEAKSNQKVLQEYAEEALAQSGAEASYAIEERLTYAAPYTIPPPIADGIYLVGQLLQKGFKLLLIVGMGVLLWFACRRQSKTWAPVALVALASFITLVLSIALPFASIEYDVNRSYQQLLVVLSLPTLIVGCLFTGHIRRRVRAAMAVAIAALFAFNAPLIGQLIGGTAPSMLFSNVGSSYSHYYVAQGELYAGNWLLTQAYNKGDIIRADRMGSQRLILHDAVYFKQARIAQDILPPLINPQDFVYVYHANKEGIATLSAKGVVIDYAFPNDSIEQRKNQIYSNSRAAIYK